MSIASIRRSILFIQTSIFPHVFRDLPCVVDSHWQHSHPLPLPPYLMSQIQTSKMQFRTKKSQEQIFLPSPFVNINAGCNMRSREIMDRRLELRL